MWILLLSVPAIIIIIIIITQTTRSNHSSCSSSCSNSSNNYNNVYYNDYNIIIEGTIPPYFPCIHSQQQQQQQREAHSIECSMAQIQQQQERILTSLQQQLLVSSSLSSFVTNTHHTNTTTHCPPWTILQIQQLDASYQMINAIYLRITLTTTTTTTTTNPPDTDVHRQPPPAQESQEQQRLWLLSILNAHQATPSNHTPDILQIHMSSTPSTTTTQSIIENDVQYIPPQPQSDRTTSTEHLLQRRRRRRRRTKHQTRRRTTSTSTTNRHHPNHTLPPPPLRTVGADRAHAMVLPMVHSTTTTTTIHKSDYANSSPTTTTTTTATNTTLQNITGVGIRIAILDGGVDYTHIALNGIGTRAAFVQAYGTSIDDVRNTMTHPSDTTTTTTTGSTGSTNHWNTTPPYFPTDTIIDGYDTLGDVYNNRNDDNHRDTPQNPHHPHNNPFLMDRSSYLQARPDPNPMDLNGHGTAVTHVIRTVAPSAQFIAVKVCSTSVTTSSTPVICPDFAILRGLEYLLDRNHDNVIDTDLVHIINISIGRMYISSYYNLLSKVIESLITTFNIVVVISSGNYGNVPFILGDFAGTPNAITVGATAVSDTNPYNNSNNGDNDETSPATATTRRTMAAYSSRGPAASIQNKIKPDIVAPGGPYSLAYASTGNEYRTFQGTSFSTPYTTGGVALLKQKCLSCSPLSIKALLMNHAAHTIHSSVPTTATATTPTTKSSTLMTTTAETSDEWAPVTLQGSGEMQIHKSLLATYWVYCIEDMNPSISLGLIDAAMSPTIQIHRTLRITKLTNTTDTLYLKYELRSLIHAKTISIRFNTPERNFIVLDGSCQDEYIVNVTFVIHTSMAPSNHMYAGGAASTNPNNLDHNEIDGWIILSSSQKHENDTETRTRTNGDDDNDENNDVSIPFHMIVRKAANITVGPSPSTTISAPVLNENIFDRLPMNVTVDLQNHGTETAQIDSFQLIYMSTDQPESDFGSNHPPADIRYVGYRTIPVSDDGNYCTTLIEFAIQTWERQQSLTYTHFNIWIDLDYDNMAEHTVYNSAYRLGSTHSEMRRIDLRSNREYCIGYTPDHTTNTANTVLRFCAEDIGIVTKNVPTILNVAISSYSFPGDEITDLMDYRNITISQVGLGAPSYNIEAGATLQNISVYGSGRVPQSTLSSSFMNDTATLSTRPMGLLLFTNSFRSWTSTGSATHDSEAIVIVRTDIVPPPEVTPDVITFPVLQNTDGPSCCSWAHIIRNTTTSPLQCSINRRLELRSQTSTSNLTDWLNTIISKGQSRRSRISSTSSPSAYYRNDQYRFNRYHHRILQRQDTTCPEYTIPRVSPIRVAQQK